MEFLSEIFGSVAGSSVAVPLGQFVIFVVLTTFCLLFGRYKVGLIIAYVFTLCWAYIVNRQQLMESLGSSAASMGIYLLIGLLMICTALLRAFAKED